MISELKGILAYKGEDGIVIDVAGVGYEVGVPNKIRESLPDVGQFVHLFIYTHVAEAVLALFGFSTRLEKALFKKLISVSGIGPKSAIQILSGLSADDLVHALITSDLARLTAISGIGKKTAERMLVELKDKMLDFVSSDETKFKNAVVVPKGVWGEVTSALINLGYHKLVADKVIDDLRGEDDLAFAPALRKALSQLARN